MIAAVTGAGGFIGSHLCQALEAEGISLRRLERTAQAQRLAVDLESSSVADWEVALDGADIVINVAGLAHDVRGQTPERSSEYFAVNAHGAARVAAASRNVGAARFMQISTIKVLGSEPRDGARFREGDSPSPVGTYAESKALGESLVSAELAGTGTECVILRLPLVLASPFKGNLALLERAIRRGVPLPLGHPTIGLRTYVRMPDLTDLILEVVGHPGPIPRVLHARSTPDFAAGEVARLIGREIGRPPRMFPVPARTIRRLSRVVGMQELASKLCDPMLVSDDETRKALGLDLRQ